MEGNSVAISVKGKLVSVPSLRVSGRDVIVTGKWLRKASIFEEDWLEDEPVTSPGMFLKCLKNSSLFADYFTFSQLFTAPKARFEYPFELDNIAAIPISTFEEWWEKRVSHELRRDVKRAEKRGVVVRKVEFNDEFARGIQGIYNESPLRQGRRFWHYGKDFESVKRENATFHNRSEFIGAYYGDELIGFIKIVHARNVARMMQIISLEKHQDKRPGNALISKAVELAAHRGCSYLTYGKFTYDNKRRSSVVLYKRRNGFEEILFPRYYVPLTLSGQFAIRARLHLSWRRLIPEHLTYVLLNLRGKARALALRHDGIPVATESTKEQLIAAEAGRSSEAKPRESL